MDEQAILTGRRHNNEFTEKFTSLFDSVGDDGIGGIEEGRKTKYEFQRLQIIDISVTLTAIIGGFLTIFTVLARINTLTKIFIVRSGILSER